MGEIEDSGPNLTDWSKVRSLVGEIKSGEGDRSRTRSRTSSDAEVRELTDQLDKAEAKIKRLESKQSGVKKDREELKKRIQQAKELIPKLKAGLEDIKELKKKYGEVDERLNRAAEKVLTNLDDLDGLSPDSVTAVNGGFH